MMTLEQAKSFFQKDRFACAQAGISIVAVDDNYAKCAMPVTPNHKNAAGAEMGGALFTLADFAFAVAANISGTLTVTVSSNINFISVCRGSMLYAEAHLIKDGKRSCFYEIPIRDESGALIALVTSSGMHLQTEPHDK